jgi:hypothetical protein
MIDRGLVVQLQPAVAQPPIVADPMLPVDNQRIEPDPLQFDSGGNAGVAAADNENVGLAIPVLG